MRFSSLETRGQQHRTCRATQLEQLHVKLNCEHGRHLGITASHTRGEENGCGLGTRLGYRYLGTSGLAELKQLLVESNTEHSRHLYNSSLPSA